METESTFQNFRFICVDDVNAFSKSKQQKWLLICQIKCVGTHLLFVLTVLKRFMVDFICHFKSINRVRELLTINPIEENSLSAQSFNNQIYLIFV